MKIEKKRRVVITGLGTVNPTGNTVAESWAAVKAGRCAVGPITAFDTTDFKVKLAAEVKNFDFSKNPYEIQAEYQKMFVDGKKKSFATKHFSVMFLSLSTAFYTNTICTVNFSLFTI